jgi:molybdenum cofactor biosynthesis protein B
VEEHKRDQKAEAVCALVVTSDVRRPETDETGEIAIRLLEGDGHTVVAHIIVKNDSEQIKEAIERLLEDERIKVVITSGGTGIGAKDMTVDTVTLLFDKRIEGFGELFRRLSFKEVGHSAILSRATAGVAAGKLIFCLPGSRNAVELALREIILPSLGHMIWEVERGR